MKTGDNLAGDFQRVNSYSLAGIGDFGGDELP
jgi:hypothetical protein